MTAGNFYAETLSLHTFAGERKYLNEAELKRFYKALRVLTNPKERTFVEFVYWTGCRVCEALSMTLRQMLFEDRRAVIRSAKKRGESKDKIYRVVPLPRDYFIRLRMAYDVYAHSGKEWQDSILKIWTFSRTTAWRLVKRVMRAAGISGIRACYRGLRHSRAVKWSLDKMPLNKIKDWLGHESIATTEIYLNTMGAEDHMLAARSWGGERRLQASILIVQGFLSKWLSKPLHA